MRKGQLAAPRAVAMPPPAPLRPRPPQSQCSDDSMDDKSTASSADDLQQSMPLPPEAPSPQRPRKEGSVQVAVRVRPLLPKEIAARAGACVREEGDNSISLQGADRRFTFDHVFPQRATQDELYEKALEPWLESFLQGFNVTVIAYGQTGSGKTYTMGNNLLSSVVEGSYPQPQLPGRPSTTASGQVDALKPNEGLIPRFLHQLFAKLNEATADEHQVSVSFLEIYGEEVHDLLRSTNSQRGGSPDNLHLRENRSGVYVEGLTEVNVSSRNEAMEQMKIGSIHRITGSTEMNERSSRSHAVYTIKIVRKINNQSAPEQDSSKRSVKAPNTRQPKSRQSSAAAGANTEGKPSPNDSSSATVISKLTFVDLAGSERLKKTLAEGNRMKEGIQINVGLLALGNVINALGDERHHASSHRHVPYRSSKLTRLLQDALGGNSRTLFIACVSPAESNVSETLSTLQYANRAKNIQNKAVKNIDSRSAELLNMKAFNELLQRELIKSRFVRMDRIKSGDDESIVETMLAEPKVLSYLRVLEKLALSHAGDDGKLSRELRQALFKLSSQFPGVSRRDCSDVPGEVGDDIGGSYSDSGLDLSTDDETFSTSTDDTKDEDALLSVPYSLSELSRALDIISATFEVQELQDQEIRYHRAVQAKITLLDTKMHRAGLLQQGTKEILDKMSGIVSKIPATEDTTEAYMSMQKQMQRYVDKLDRANRDAAELERKKTALSNELAERLSQCRANLQSKRDRIRQLRQMGDSLSTTATPLGVLSRSTDIKDRFKVSKLFDISNSLTDEESDAASFLDEEIEDIARIPTLFTNEEAPSAGSMDIFTSIRNELQRSMDNEDLNASLSKEIRLRATLLDNIVRGWSPVDNGHSPEQAYLVTSRQKMRECEDHIAEITAALDARKENQVSFSAILDSISSLDLSKEVVRILIQELYSQKRLYMVSIADQQNNEAGIRDIEGPPSDERQAGVADASEEKCADVLESDERDLRSALDMVTSFTANVGAQLSNLQAQQLGQKSAADEAKINKLLLREETLATELQQRDKEVAKLQVQMLELQQTIKSNEVKQESYRLMDRCQEIWSELGLNAEDQASKFNDINELLLRKCSEELEGLEAAREKIQQRIDKTHSIVKLLEVVVEAEQPIDLEILRSVAGKTLLEQEKHLLGLQQRMTGELWLRVDARIKALDSIQDLLAELKLENVRDFRHPTSDAISGIDIGTVRQNIALLPLWKARKEIASKDLESITPLLESLTVSGKSAISAAIMKQDEVLLSELYREQKERFIEADQLLRSIRSVAEEMGLTPDDIQTVIHNMIDADRLDPFVVEVLAHTLVPLITQSGGTIDISNKGMAALRCAQQGFGDIFDGRSNAVAFMTSLVQEANALTKQSTSARNSDEPSPTKRQNRNGDSNDVTSNEKEHRCDRGALLEGKKRIDELSLETERLIQIDLITWSNNLMQFGIESDDQRVSFLLGKDDIAEENATRAIFHKYISFSGANDSTNDIANGCEIPHRHDSLLSEIDPDYDELHDVYSVSYGAEQLRMLNDAIAHSKTVRDAIAAANERIVSLKTITDLYSKINDYKEEIAAFEAHAKDKSRLFGSSLKLLEEERYRKAAAKEYPKMLSALRHEVRKWHQNEDRGYNLDLLGQSMKNLVIDTMNTDTGLMHLDLGVVGTTRQAARRGSKTSLTPTPSSSSLHGASPGNNAAAQIASAPSRARSLSTLSRDSSAKKRLQF